MAATVGKFTAKRVVRVEGDSQSAYCVTKTGKHGGAIAQGVQPFNNLQAAFQFSSQSDACPHLLKVLAPHCIF